MFTQYHLTNGWGCPIIVQCVGTKGARLGHLRLQSEKGFHMAKYTAAQSRQTRGSKRRAPTTAAQRRARGRSGGGGKLRAASNAARQRRRKVGR